MSGVNHGFLSIEALRPTDAIVDAPPRASTLANDCQELSVAPRPSAVSAAPVTDIAPIVLIVEDNVVNQIVLTAQLASLGYRADVAVNGFDALETLGRNDYAAVFMDCQMPVMDGFETTRQLRLREGRARHTCVIAVTAAAMAADRDRCLEAGMDDCLTKPINAGDLAAKLTYWLSDDGRRSLTAA